MTHIITIPTTLAMYRVTADRPTDLPTRRSTARNLQLSPRRVASVPLYSRIFHNTRVFLHSVAAHNATYMCFHCDEFLFNRRKTIIIIILSYGIILFILFARPSFRYFMYLSYVSNSGAVVVPGGSRTLTTDKFCRIKSSRATAICRILCPVRAVYNRHVYRY